MKPFPRSAGVLCHVTSLPGSWGIGDLGDAAYRFVDWLAEAGQGIWQILPLGPPGYGESPYQSYSAFAGNPLLVGLDRLAEEGCLSRQELNAGLQFDLHKVEFERLRPFREHCLTKAQAAFEKSASAVLRNEFDAFRDEQGWWLNDYALFSALKSSHGGKPWTEWEPELVVRQSAALRACEKSLKSGIEREEFIQFQFHRQWRELKSYANGRGVRVMGDLPIFVAHDSADVWANQGQFSLDERGRPTVVAGVPPDYFSATGQRWGNPLYRWDAMREDGYGWWIKRFRHALAQVDLVRVDHFRGFAGYWEIPAENPTAAGGRWVTGPGAPFFEQILSKLGRLPLVAEDLGVITEEVEDLRDTFEFPGMRVLQFAFGDDPKASDYQPHNYPRNCVVYTGTHDNDTTVGWFHSSADQSTTRTADQIADEKRHALQYIGTKGTEIHWDMIRLALASVADTAIVPLQDVLGLGTTARMNLPGTAQGNWIWRFAADQLTSECRDRLRELTTIYDRLSSGNAPLHSGRNSRCS